MTDSLTEKANVIGIHTWEDIEGNSNNVAQAHGNFGLQREHVSKSTARSISGDTHAFNPVAHREVSYVTGAV